MPKMPQNFTDLVGKAYSYKTSSKTVQAVVLDIRWSHWYITVQNNKVWAVELKLKPVDGGVSFWSKPLPTSIRKEVTL